MAAVYDHPRGEELLDALESGELRAAEPPEAPGGTWRVNAWIKAELLSIFAASPLVEGSDPALGAPGFLDKRAFPLRRFALKDGVRLVPGGSAVRRGAHLGRGVICMPPMYVNVGAFVGEGTMIDSHALVGSCAQVGRNVHLSGGVGIGGVLEPLQARPTIIEDDCFIGARSEVVEGVVVERGAVLSMGVFIGASTRIYDRETREVSYGRVPAGAVVVPGSLPAPDGSHSLYCAVIVKRVDAQTRAKTGVNELLRD